MAPDPATTAAPPRDAAALIDTLDLSDLQKEMLRSRWLDQTGWMSAKATQARRRYFALRVPTVIGGVIVPVLVGLGIGAACGIDAVRILTVIVSGAVAVLIGLEELFHFGDTWRHYRRTAEMLKGAGWQYLLLVGPYRRSRTHKAAYPAFTSRVEEILAEDVEGYFERVAVEGPVAKSSAG